LKKNLRLKENFAVMFSLTLSVLRTLVLIAEHVIASDFQFEIATRRNGHSSGVTYGLYASGRFSCEVVRERWSADIA
jgi:hypothetical protein